MEPKDCPFHVAEEQQRQEFTQRRDDCRLQIECDMRSLGLSPENMVSAVISTATTMARYQMMADQCACLPLTYIEVSREGNRKPVSRPEFSMLNAVSNSLAQQLKQLGIYVSSEKVATNASEKKRVMSPMQAFMSQCDDE